MKNGKNDGASKATLKEKIMNWMKQNPALAKVLAVVILVAVFCIILSICKGKSNESLLTPERKAAQTAQQGQQPPTEQKKAEEPEIPPAPEPAPEPEVQPLTAPKIEITLPGNQKMKLIRIKKGTFKMGSPVSERGRHKSEGQKLVTITEDFYIGVFEVTQAQYKAVMGDNPSFFRGDNLPVDSVSSDNALVFCDNLNIKSAPKGWVFTLPTSAQWEYACRADTVTPFFWGKTLNGDNANCNGLKPYGINKKGTFLKKTAPVGSYKPNAWGLYDMHGNVWEWCRDDQDGKNYVRGGAWGYGAAFCRSAVKLSMIANPKPSVAKTIGFRVILKQEK